MPKCPRCTKEVYSAEEVVAAGSKWHSGCFKCKECSTGLSSSNLQDKDKEIYCAPCYGKLFGAKGFRAGGVSAINSFDEKAAVEAGTAQIEADIQKKLAAKLSPEDEATARAFLEKLLGETFEEKTLQEALKSGERLCAAMNKVYAGMVKNINKQKFAAMQRENISSYINACKNTGFDSAHMFETADLYDGNNMVLVIANILALKRKSKVE
jgi:cysteine/glycine-rich protein